MKLSEFKGGIITADWHNRLDRPKCRKDDDWLQVQRKKIRGIVQLANTLHLPVYHTGDVFHRAKNDTALLNMILVELSDLLTAFYVIPGNHDLPYHSIDQVQEAAIYPLVSGVLKNCNLIPGATAFNVAPVEDEVMFIHKLVFKDEKSRPYGAEGVTAAELCKKYPTAKYILTGDNHEHFIYNAGGQMVINPGCLSVQSSKMIEYVPGVVVFEMQADGHSSVHFHKFPEDRSMLTHTHILEQEDKEDRIMAFVEKLRTNSAVSLSFTENLKKEIDSEHISKCTKTSIIKILEKVGITL